jgi:hypothetical protein
VSKQTEFGAGLGSKLRSLAIRYQHLPDGQRRALLAKARRELLGNGPSASATQGGDTQNSRLTAAQIPAR